MCLPPTPCHIGTANESKLQISHCLHKLFATTANITARCLTVKFEEYFLKCHIRMGALLGVKSETVSEKYQSQKAGMPKTWGYQKVGGAESPVKVG